MSRAGLGSLAFCLLALLSLAHGALQHSPPLPGVLRLRAAHGAGGCSSVHAAEDAARERKAVKQGSAVRGAPAQTEEEEEEEYDDTCAQQMLAAVEIAARRATLQRFAGGLSRLRGGKGELSSEDDEEGDAGGSDGPCVGCS
ncbi:hypothetical protein T484DRAFT_1820634 [Baffinella frigidus]|nr:hypothetical protein T484DRAFT_1820634 [Cryptophyta sp. CCMP2293]